MDVRKNMSTTRNQTGGATLHSGWLSDSSIAAALCGSAKLQLHTGILLHSGQGFVVGK